MHSIATSRSFGVEVTSQQGYGAAAVTPHVLATQAAMNIMDAGGNAVDAMVAADAVLGVVAPETCGIGGDLFALVLSPGESIPAALNASGRAGAGADADALLEAGHHTVPPFHQQTVTVPGCVRGWSELLSSFGSLPLASLLRPALRLAADGFPASDEMCSALAARGEAMARQPAAEGLFPGGNPPSPGERIFRPGLYRTLVEIAERGPSAFYEGRVAQEICDATEGVLSAQDLAAATADWVEPLSIDVFGSTAWTVPLNSQGYLTLAASAAYELLEGPVEADSPESWHLAIESYRAMAFDRNEVVADPESAPLPSTELVSPRRIATRAGLIDKHRASPFAPPSPVPGGTAYLCAVDANGMGVSFIQSNFMGLGSGIGAGSAGFFLQNRGAGFDLRPGHPNRLQPGRRPLHTLSPTLWTRQGLLSAVLGTRGGDYQPQLLLQLAIRMFWQGLEPSAALARPRWMIEHFDQQKPQVAVEFHTPESIVADLVGRGHDVQRRTDTQHGWGPISVITVDERGLRTAAADGRVRTATAAVS